MAYNGRSPAVKRLMKEAQELSESTELFHAQPLEDNLFEWHFTIRGPSDTDFNGGIYHGRILLPTDYPMKPPNIMLLTPNGRFDTNRKICLSISGYHPESWRPSWSIRTALLAIIGFMPTHGSGAIGSVEYPPEERRRLAKRSLDFQCPDCGETRSILKPLTEASTKDREEANDLAAQIDFKPEKSKSTTEASETDTIIPEVVPSSPTVAAPSSVEATTSSQPQPGVNNPIYNFAGASTLSPSAAPWYSMPSNFSGMPCLDPSAFAPPLNFTQWLQQVKGIAPRSPEPPINVTASTEQVPSTSTSQPQSSPNARPTFNLGGDPIVPPATESVPSPPVEGSSTSASTNDGVRQRRPVSQSASPEPVSPPPASMRPVRLQDPPAQPLSNIFIVGLLFVVIFLLTMLILRRMLMHMES